jgi:hypothetical protein
MAAIPVVALVRVAVVALRVVTAKPVLMALNAIAKFIAFSNLDTNEAWRARGVNLDHIRYISHKHKASLDVSACPLPIVPEIATIATMF